MKFKKFIIINFLLFLLLSVTCSKSFASSIIQPFADFTFYNFNNQWEESTNPSILASSSLSSRPEAITYLKFNTSNISNNSSAQLSVNNLLNIVLNKAGTANLDVYKVSDDWSNINLSHTNSLPIATIGSALSSIQISSSFDLNNTLTWNIGNISNQNILSLAIITKGNGFSGSLFDGSSPQLKVESPAPAPSSLFYSLAGLIGLFITQLNNKKLLGTLLNKLKLAN